MRHSRLSLLVLPLLLTACRDTKIADYKIPKENDAPTAQAPAQPAAASQPGMADMPVARAEGVSLTWTVPASWQTKPASGMRKATLLVAEGAELAVTAFPGDVGGELANLNRWRGQLGLAPVTEAEQATAITRLTAGPLQIAVVDLLGGTPDKPVRMLGAMVPNGGATWFFKLMGPDATVEQAKPAFMAFLETLKVTGAAPAIAADAAMPADHPAIGASPAAPAASDMANTPVIKAAGPGLNWTAPANWQSRPPTAMRKATYAVPGDAGAVGDLAVTAFPGDVGGELANVNRWRGQLGLAPLAATEVEGVVTRLTPHGLNVALVDFAGGTADKPVRMLGAIVPYGGATWFFKLTGPVALVAKEKPAFVAFVQSLGSLIPMPTLLRDIRDLLVSLKLTVLLIVFSIVLILAATIDQVNLGIWAVQAKYFHTFVVFWKAGNVSLAVFPGGYTIGGLLLLNLLGAHFYRFKLSTKKIGIWLAHAGLILLLVGQLLTGLWQDEFQLRLDQGQSKNYAESYRNVELVLTDTTDPKTDEVVAIPEKPLARLETVQHPKLPFRVAVKTYFPNATLQMRGPMQPADPAAPATQGVGSQILATLQPLTYKQEERNIPAAYVELLGPDGSLGTWLVSPLLEETQRFAFAGRNWKIALRFARSYQPYTLTLLKFSHDRYAGTEIPKNFSSRIRLTTPDGRDDREVLIYMNNPLRYAGLTFYQAGFENNDQTTVLQVVRNPSWLIPYVACGLMTAGLLIQFGIHLTGFFSRRTNGAKATTPAAALPATPRKNWIPLSITAVAVVAVVATLLPPRNPGEYDLAAFSHLPTLVNGRIKPLDTVARTSLLMLQGRQRVTTPNGRSLTPTEWLLDVMYRPEVANEYPTFEINHPDALAMLNLTSDDGFGVSKNRFTFTKIQKGLDELERQSKLADAVESALRTPFQKAVLQLRDAIVLYQSLQVSLLPPHDEHFLDQLANFDATVPAGMTAVAAQHAGKAPDMAAAKVILGLSDTAATLESVAYLRLIPPQVRPTDPLGWSNAGAALHQSLDKGKLDPSLAFYAQLGLAWRGYQSAKFNSLVHDYRASLDRSIPAFMTKCDTEARFNSAEPFYTSMLIYVVAFLVAVFSWLKWPDELGRAAFRLVLLAWILATVGIGIRMWLEGRPPVTNLYSSALFVGWAAVALCLVLERLYRNAIGSVTAGLVGFSTLLIAHHLALGGDTLEMMRAVLDSNFWLATHVVTVTVGYAATFLAGFLALLYVVRGVFTKSLDKDTADALARMVYGIVCFATLFSFIGTVLGGIWADQSWGRFWGWDPKENGALIIVLWNALILHARWGGMVKQRGLMNLAIFGNIVTGWSWFGVNMLGVGLHSYGFMDAAFWWLLAFVISQVVLILIGSFPLAKWRSFRSPAPA